MERKELGDPEIEKFMASLDPITRERMQKAIENGVHCDVAVNPFISDKGKDLIIEGQMQDGEFD